jgi:hypothetical protein
MIRILVPTCIVQLASVLMLPALVMAQTKQATVASKADKREWGKAVEGQTLSIAADKAAYTAGDRIVVTTTWKNVGRKDVEIWGIGPLATYEVKVLLPSGKEAPLTLYGQKHAAARKARADVIGGGFLKPGEEDSSSLELSRFFDFSLSGKYKVSEQRFVRRDPTSKETLYAVSNEITITVESPPEK